MVDEDRYRIDVLTRISTIGRHEAHGDGVSGSAHHDHGGGPAEAGAVSWRMAAQATLHCLTGCAIGEVLGMVVGTVLGLHNAATVVLAIVLAFVFGYALTMRGVLRAGLGARAAFGVALAADTVSIAVMELLDNAVVVAVPGAMDAGLCSGLFWGSLAFSLLVAFVLTTPVNRWMISRGRGARGSPPLPPLNTATVGLFFRRRSNFEPTERRSGAWGPAPSPGRSWPSTAYGRTCPRRRGPRRRPRRGSVSSSAMSRPAAGCRSDSPWCPRPVWWLRSACSCASVRNSGCD
jgi:hypothetical protein